MPKPRVYKKRTHAQNVTRRVKPLPAREPGDLLFASLATVGRARGTHAGWIWDVVEAIRSVASVQETLTVEDVRMLVSEPPDDRQFGTAFREAARLGHVRNSGRFVNVKRTDVGTPRARPVVVWESLL